MKRGNTSEHAGISRCTAAWRLLADLHALGQTWPVSTRCPMRPGSRGACPTRSARRSGEAARRPGSRVEHERRRRKLLAATLAEFALRAASRPATYAPAGPTPSVNGSHQSSKRRMLDADRERRLLDRRAGRLPRTARRDGPRARPRGRDSSSTSGSSSRAASQYGLERPAAAGVIPDARGDDAVRVASRAPSRAARPPDRP